MDRIDLDGPELPPRWSPFPPTPAARVLPALCRQHGVAGAELQEPRTVTPLPLQSPLGAQDWLQREHRCHREQPLPVSPCVCR